MLLLQKSVYKEKADSSSKVSQGKKEDTKTITKPYRKYYSKLVNRLGI